MQNKPCSILLAIPRAEKPYVSLLMKEADTTFAHTTNILSDMAAYGLVDFVSEGRMKYVKLTRRGRDVLKSLQSLDGALGGGDLLKDLKRLELRVNGIETRLKAGELSERMAKRTAKALDEITIKSGAIERDAGLFRNERLDYEVRVMKERLDYLKTKLPAGETPEDQSFQHAVELKVNTRLHINNINIEGLPDELYPHRRPAPWLPAV
jgi:predicted transcriptional regulator